MKIQLSLLLLFLSTLQVTSQDSGFLLGFSSGISVSHNPEIVVSNATDLPYFGPSEKIYARFYFKPGFYLEPSLGLRQCGYKIYTRDNFVMPQNEYSDSYHIIDYTYAHNYLFHDWQIGYSSSGKLQYNVSLGVYSAVYLKTRGSFYYATYMDPEDYIVIKDPAIEEGLSENSEVEVYRKDNMNTVDVGLSGSAGVSYSLSDRFVAELALKYNYGFSDIYRETEYTFFESESYNRSLFLMVGIGILLNTEEKSRKE